jgi:hypothetical protein
MPTLANTDSIQLLMQTMDARGNILLTFLNLDRVWQSALKKQLQIYIFVQLHRREALP